MPIPQYIKASTGLAQSQRYTGEIETAKLARLLPELAQAGDPLAVDLRLERDGQGDWVRGEVRGALVLECRRCSQPFPWPFDQPIELRLVHTEQEEAEVLQEADPYRVEDDRLPLQELVEDELLLALPMMPRCQKCEAAPATVLGAQEESKEELAPQAANSFGQLLKNATGAVGPRRK